MTDDELDQVEAALGRPLPAAYRRFVRGCPPGDLARYLPTLYTSPHRLIRHNQGMDRWAAHHSVREPDGAGGWLPERPWPADWLVIGDRDGEWYDFVRPDADGPGLWRWQHDHHEVERVAESLEAALAAGRADKAPPPPEERSTHPALGELTWDPEIGWWSLQARAPDGRPVLVDLRPSETGKEAVLDAAVELLPRALAAEPAAFDAALADGLMEEAAEYPEDCGQPPTPEAVRGLLRWYGLSIDARSGDPEITYTYDPGGRLGADVVLITADADLRYRHYIRVD